MHISSDDELIIFKNDSGYYSVGLSRKDRNNQYIYGYFPCQFKKGVELEKNSTRIKVKNAFISFYLKDEKTMPYLMIVDFEEAPKRENYAKLKGEEIEENMPF